MQKFLFVIAPAIIFTAVFSGFAVVPFTPDLLGSSSAMGIFFLLAIVSLDVLGVLLAGWGSNNKFGLYGSMRAVAQIVSYEIPLSLSALCVIITCSTLNLQEMCFQQGTLISSTYSESIVDTTHNQNYLLGLKATGINLTTTGGFLTWNIFRSPILIIAFVVFFISSLAEANRAPFDLPEAESELIGGYHTEYSGFRWAMFMLSEYGMMLLSSFLAAILFFGGWNTPLPNIDTLKLADWTSGTPGTFAANAWGVFWMLSKVFGLIFLQIWARWTYPRLRVDQLMSLCWKYLLPLSLILVLISSIWKIFMI
ncbi:MAG: complex I subunit 1 family protein [Bacteroidota bacterium]